MTSVDTSLSDSAANGGGQATMTAITEESQSPLTAAFEAVGHFPVLAESRETIQEAANGAVRSGEITGIVESDVGLTIGALRLANGAGGRGGQGVATVPDAIEVIGPLGAVALAGSAATFDLLDTNEEARGFEQFRLHALAVQRAADQLAVHTGAAKRAELAVASLLHDVGHLVTSRLRTGREPIGDALNRPPEERLQDEREALRIDHALVGGVLARRWRFPPRLADAIERHHAEDATGLAAHVSLADMIVHYGQGDAFSPERLEAARMACGLSEDDLGTLLREFPGSPRQPTPEACPLSDRELEILRKLAEGKTNGEIALATELSTSTVRSHLHNIYGKMGVNDRAQAVLSASELGWI
jgi:putative nucleotidyltransferase with HDIG domain